ncbi:MAG: DUF1566 domain-containing protein [Gammaproteobacteria bacterium]|nr:DUF1566 domain-containing protein [Gammaproteobacteria bacterium]
MNNAKPIAAGLLALGLAVSTGRPQAAVTCANENSAVAETTATADFTDNGNGTVTDTRTGLVWMRCSLGQTWDGSTCIGTAGFYTWQAALQAALDINSGASDVDGDDAAGYAGASDWRLPNRNELGSIVERRCWYPAINAALFPKTPVSYFWSSSPYAGSPNNAWIVYFDFGHTNNPNIKDYTNRVRLVRAGQ